MTSRRRKVTLLVGVVIVCVWLYNRPAEVDKQLPMSRSSRNTHRILASSALSGAKSTGVGRQPDDGVWYDFSDPPSLLFYAYSAFVDDRPLEPKLCNKRLLCVQCSIFLMCVVIFHLQENRDVTTLTN